MREEELPEESRETVLVDRPALAPMALAPMAHRTGPPKRHQLAPQAQIRKRSLTAPQLVEFW